MSSIEKSADENDMASDMEESFRDAAIAAVRSHLKQTHPGFDGSSCLDCTDPIIEFRLTLGRIRCVDCQTLLERKEKGLYVKA